MLRFQNSDCLGCLHAGCCVSTAKEPKRNAVLSGANWLGYCEEAVKGLHVRGPHSRRP